MAEKKKKDKLWLICDVAFELVLVLLVLLSAMLLSKNDVIAGPGGYHVEPISLIATFGLLVFYLIFMVRTSLKSIEKQKESGEKVEEVL